MTDWRIVPSETTPALNAKLEETVSGTWGATLDWWSRLVSAAPRASEDEALVEMLVIALMDKPVRPPTLVAARQIVRTILKALEPPNCVPKEDG